MKGRVGLAAGCSSRGSQVRGLNREVAQEWWSPVRSVGIPPSLA